MTLPRLRVGDWEAELAPDVGGAITALRMAGVPILRETRSSPSHPLQTACFAMVPYANRIAQGRFTFNDRPVQIAPNFPPQRHPLHGMGWLTRWNILRHDDASILLEHQHSGDSAWPWAYRAHQHVSLDRQGCTVRLMVENLSDETAPMGLGLHPYFRRFADTVLQFEADAMLGIDDEFLPDGESHPVDRLAAWPKGSALPDVLTDHCFTGWSGHARISDALGDITLRGFGTPCCHVFAPPAGDELCVEPVTQTPDAFNRAADEVPTVLPGRATGIAMRIEATPATGRRTAA